MARELEGRVALVTGGDADVGKAAALAFAEHGASVAIAVLEADRGRALARTIEEAGGRAVFIRADVSDAGDVERMIGETVSAFGRLDCAFNNAGIESGLASPPGGLDASFDHSMALHLIGVGLCLRYEIMQMLEQQGEAGGVIVNMSSVPGGVTANDLPAYVASKHGVIGLTKTAALEYARCGIRINAICPGMIHSEMVERAPEARSATTRPQLDLEPMCRLGTPEQVAAGVVWLCSNAASYVTGHAMSVDGGFETR